MLSNTRLVVFDLDGTLVDSQATIVRCAQAAFRAEGLAPPPAPAIRRIVGLSLVQAMEVLLARDEVDQVLAARLAEHYRQAFFEHRREPDFDEPLFPGAREVLDGLRRRNTLMGIATGKAMRGLRSVLERHGLDAYFVTLQTADLHPSKPHPSMVQAALAETGSEPGQALVVGDTTYDVAMAVAAGVTAVGVGWGNHPADELREAGAAHIVRTWGELSDLLGLVAADAAGNGGAGD
jgi:phosphoglycolate phosphatase